MAYVQLAGVFVREQVPKLGEELVHVFARLGRHLNERALLVSARHIGRGNKEHLVVTRKLGRTLPRHGALALEVDLVAGKHNDAVGHVLLELLVPRLERAKGLSVRDV